jgi:titin
VELETGVPTQHYTTTVPLTPDTIYTFKVRARNSVGYSLESETISIKAAEVPYVPINLVNVPDITTAYQIGLDWDAPTYDGGSPVLDYRLSYKETSSSDWIVYDDAILDTQITVISLTPGVYYDFKVEARNIVGYSDFSDSITELAAQIPDSPTDLANVPEITLADRIGLTWLAPVFDGGSAILDYRIWYDDASDGAQFVELVSGLNDLSYTALGLTQGSTYRFKVEARNVYGYSFAFSNQVEILAA